MKQKNLIIKWKNHVVEIPYFEFESKQKKGSHPHIIITGGMHGDEINGIEVVKKFLDWCLKENIEETLLGKITVIPVLNPSGFRLAKRHVVEDNKDLNRQFGFSNPRTFSQKIAYLLTVKILKYGDLIIDCHDSGSNSILIPHSRIHINDDKECIGCSREIARLFGTKLIFERQGKEHMMAVAFKQMFNIPVLTVEIGGAQILYPHFIRKGLQGIKNVLISYSMITGVKKVPKRVYVLPNRFAVKTKLPAIVNMNIKLGQKVEPGDKLGTLYFPLLRQSKSIISPTRGFIFSVRTNNQVKKNGILYSILEILDWDSKAPANTKVDLLINDYTIKRYESVR